MHLPFLIFRQLSAVRISAGRIVRCLDHTVRFFCCRFFRVLCTGFRFFCDFLRICIHRFFLILITADQTVSVPCIPARIPKIHRVLTDIGICQLRCKRCSCFPGMYCLLCKLRGHKCGCIGRTAYRFTLSADTRHHKILSIRHTVHCLTVIREVRCLTVPVDGSCRDHGRDVCRCIGCHVTSVVSGGYDHRDPCFGSIIRCLCKYRGFRRCKRSHRYVDEIRLQGDRTLNAKV